jgi:glycosyltransferase involved in cell wall biosynthesis
MKRLRILMLITNLGKGGAQRVFHDHSLAFSRFASVEEVVYDCKQDIRVYNSGLPLQDLKRNEFWNIFGSIGRLISRAKALRKLVTAGGFNLVISHMDGANWVNILSFSTARKILVVHGTVMNDQNVHWLTQWLRINVIFPWLYNRAERTIAVSDGIARELRTVGRVYNVQTIPNYFDVQSIRDQAMYPLPPALESVFTNNQILVTSGRLAEQKKHTFLLDVLAALRKRGSNAKLVILGDGELRDDLIGKCSELALSAWYSWEANVTCHDSFDVYFLGHVSNPYHYLKQSSLFLFPSAWEGFPLALCEAMICDVAVVSSDCPTGPREILAPATIHESYDLQFAEFTEYGVLMPMIATAKHLDVWVETVHNLLVDETLRQRMSANAARAMQALDRDVLLPRWQALIEEMAHVD